MLRTGKLDVHILQRLLKQYARPDKRIILGPGIGEDAAALDMGETALIVSTDPITFATSEIGHYSVMVNANDIATMGAEPKWFLITILFPETEDNEDLAETIFRQIHRACDQMNILLVGGHTEITYGIDRPIIIGQMLGEVKKDELIATGGAKPGDVILLTKGICIEGTSIIAREKHQELLSKGMAEDLLERAKRFLFEPGISVVEEARLAVRAGRVHAMHDVTEGGLANGLFELAAAAGVALEIEKDRIPVFEESRVLCEAFALDPMGVIASGALLITAPPHEGEKILQEADRQGKAIFQIGRVTSAGSQKPALTYSKGNEPLPFFERDEIAKIF